MKTSRCRGGAGSGHRPARICPGQQAQAQTYSKEQTTTHKAKKAKKAKTQKRVVRNGSPYSTNPAHDVYVNGIYVGSDPDPRIRWQSEEGILRGCGRRLLTTDFANHGRPPKPGRP